MVASNDTKYDVCSSLDNLEKATKKIRASYNDRGISGAIFRSTEKAWAKPAFPFVATCCNSVMMPLTMNKSAEFVVVTVVDEDTNDVVTNKRHDGRSQSGQAVFVED